jgi:citrate lyase subunit beta/citryl-CoA lyase
MKTTARLYDSWETIRSLLFVPGDSPRKMEKALTCSADVLILDLEDSVADSQKEDARKQTAHFLHSLQKSDGSPRIMVRINGLTSPWITDDLSAVMPHEPDGILLPKAEGSLDLSKLCTMLDTYESQNSGGKTTAVLALTTETAKGVLSMPTYADLSPHVAKRLIGLTWGYEDLSCALGVPEICEGEVHTCFEPYRLARSLLLLAASAAHVLPVDGISRDFRDLSAFQNACDQAYHLGFLAKMAIHPAQVPIINQALSPSPHMIAHAQNIISAFETQPGCGVIAINGMMFDRPHYEKAKTILARAAVS